MNLGEIEFSKGWNEGKLKWLKGKMRINLGKIRLYLSEFEVINGSGLSFVWKFQFLSNKMIFSYGFTSIFYLKSSPILNFLSFLWPVLVTFDLSTFHKSKNRVIFETRDLKVFSSKSKLRNYFHLVVMTMILELFSQTICQKWAVVDWRGPCVQM